MVSVLDDFVLPAVPGAALVAGGSGGMWTSSSSRCIPMRQTFRSGPVGVGGASNLLKHDLVSCSSRGSTAVVEALAKRRPVVDKKEEVVVGGVDGGGDDDVGGGGGME